MTAAYPTTVKLAGSAVAFTDAPTTRLSDTEYQVTDSSKRVMDPAANVIVEVDADGPGAGGYAVVAPSTYRVDYLFGIITFDVNPGASALVRVDGSYLPLLPVAAAREFSIQEITELHDATCFNEGDPWKRKHPGLEDASGSIGTIEPLQTDLDPGAGTLSLLQARRDRTPVLLEIHPAATGQFWRGWILLESAEHSGGVDGLLEGSVNFQSAPVQGANQTESAGFGWGE